MVRSSRFDHPDEHVGFVVMPQNLTEASRVEHCSPRQCRKDHDGKKERADNPFPHADCPFRNRKNRQMAIKKLPAKA